MGTVPNLIAELGHMASWVDVQTNARLDGATIAEHQFIGVKNKIQNLRDVDMQAATSLVAISGMLR